MPFKKGQPRPSGSGRRPSNNLPQTLPVARALLAETQSQLSKARMELADKVVAELSRIAFYDPRRFMTWGPNGVTLIDSGALTDAEAACVAEVSETTTKDGGSVKIKMHSKLDALDKLARNLGLLRDKEADTGTVLQLILVNADPDMPRLPAIQHANQPASQQTIQVELDG